MKPLLAVVLTIAFCGSLVPVQAQSESTSRVAQASTPKVDACALLHEVEVRRDFPDATVGERNQRVEKDGAVGCQWRNATGMVVLHLIVYDGAPHSVEREAHGFGNIMADPAKAGAREAIRYESIASVGDQAIAVVEQGDAARGILRNVAFLLVQRGAHLIMLSSADLAGRDRAAALKILEELGRKAVNRL